MKVIDSKETYQQALDSNDIVVVFYWRPWCGVCHALEPRVQEALEQYPNISAYSANVDTIMDIGAQQSILSVPCVVTYYKGYEFNRAAGFINIDSLKTIWNKFSLLEK